MKAGKSLVLRKDRQIRFVLENGFFLRGKHIALRFLPSHRISPPINGSGPFLAVVISRRKEKRAVCRNRMKRQLREIFRRRQNEIPSHTAFVAIARQVDKKTQYQELEDDFLKLIQQGQ